MKYKLFVLFFVCCFANNLQASERRNIFTSLNLTTEYSGLLQEKNAQNDSLLPSLNADMAFADAIRADSNFWSIGSVFGKKESIATKLNVKVIFIDGVREEAFCRIDEKAKSHAGEWNVLIGVDVISGGSNTAHAHVQQCLDNVRDEFGYAIKNGDKVIFVPPSPFLAKPDEGDPVDTAKTDKPQPHQSESKEKDRAPKQFWGGAFVAATYNDFHGTKFGLTKLKPTGDYDLDVENADDLLGNYWGIGFNAGIGGIYLFSPHWAVNANLGISFRRGSGESNVTVKLDWKDETKKSEESDLSIEYSERQLNIDIPVTARFLVRDLLYAEAGTLFSFNVYSRNKSEITDVYGSETFRESGGLNVFEFGLLFGTGTMRRIGKGFIDFNLRFLLGITSLSDTPDSPKTWQGQFNMAYWFI